MNEVLLPEEWDMSPPFEPADRVLPGDAYWIARRLAAVPPATVAKAIEAADVSDEAGEWLRTRLMSRRRALITHGYAATTPCDVTGLRQRSEDGPARLTLIDWALFGGFVPTSQRSYEFRIVAADGESLVPPRGVNATGAIVTVPLPEAVASKEYFVVEVLSSFGTRAAPRAVDVHIKNANGQLKVVGVRH
jgi:hypothetical protein